MKTYLTCCLLLICFLCNAQPSVKKINMEDGKASIHIFFIKDNDSININLYEQFEKELRDREKLQLIECLLKFQGDTTRYVGMVHPYYYKPNALSIRFSPKSSFTTLEIKALNFIDKIAYGLVTEAYSPAPVLYDTLENIEINNCPKKVKIVFDSYRKWFEQCIQNEEIPNYYPFNEGRYVWLEGKKSYYSKDETPLFKEPFYYNNEKWKKKRRFPIPILQPVSRGKDFYPDQFSRSKLLK